MSAEATTAMPAGTLPGAFARIICATDGGRASLTAIEQAIELAPAAEVLVAAVVDPDAELILGPVGARMKCEQALGIVSERFEGIQTRMLSGRAIPTLVELVKSDRADLLAIGASDHSRVAEVMHASVMSGLAHRVSPALLIARERERFPSPIIVASDGSPHSVAAIDLAARIAASDRHSVVLVHVGGEGEGRDLSDHAVRIRKASGIEAALVLAEGDPARRIVETAERIGAGLIVVGARGVGGLRRLGSVSEHVAHDAPASVLIVRAAKGETDV